MPKREFHGIRADSLDVALRIAAANSMLPETKKLINDKPEVIQRLIDEGAPVDGPKGTSQTALVLAARANNVENVKVLLDNGADPVRKCTLPWAKGRTAAGVAEMEGRKKTAEYLRRIEAKQKKNRRA